MKQSRLMSLVESLANVLVGYVVAVVTQMAVFPLFGLAVTVTENLLSGLIIHRAPKAPGFYAEHRIKAFMWSKLLCGVHGRGTADGLCQG